MKASNVASLLETQRMRDRITGLLPSWRVTPFSEDVNELCSIHIELAKIEKLPVSVRRDCIMSQINDYMAQPLSSNFSDLSKVPALLMELEAVIDMDTGLSPRGDTLQCIEIRDSLYKFVSVATSFLEYLRERAAQS